MPPIEIRPFRRSDRGQLTALVNAHIEAVVPGVSVSPNAVLSQLEREPGEYVVDPWVNDRHTLVAVHRDRIAGAAHLLGYATDERVGPDYRGGGEIRWLLFWPGQFERAVLEMNDVADALIESSIAALRARGASRLDVAPSLPAPAVYGIPDRWPHVAAALTRAGFVALDSVEAVLAAAIDDLPRGGPPPLPGLTLRVALGGHATRFSAVLDERVVGMYEVQSDLTEGGTLSRFAGWADTWERWVHPDHRRRGIATWLLGHAADRLRLGGVRRVLDCATISPVDDADESELPFLRRMGFTELTRTQKSWRLER